VKGSTERLRTFGAGLGWALAVSLPAALLAQILDAVADDDLPSTATVPLAVVVMAGAVVGGWVVGRRRPRTRVLVALAVGAAVLGLVSLLGVARRDVRGDDADALVVVGSVVVGGALGLVGAAAESVRAGRTRP
jgi:hypothetical protein